MNAIVFLNKSVLFGLCLMLFAARTSYRPDRPPAGVFGEYVGAGKSTSGKPVTRKSDQVRIVRNAAGNISIAISLTFGGGQICELEGNAVWTNGQFVMIADGLDESKPCRLILRISGSMLTLQDTEGRCRDVYCGTSGQFDGAQFRKKM